MMPKTPVYDYADCLYPQMTLVNQNKMSYNIKNQIPYFKFNEDTAFHFDATKFGIWLRDHFCVPKGVKHIVDDVVSVETDDNGIKSLNKKYTADLYVDCTGFKSLLLGESLKEPFISYSHKLPNNKAWATRVPYKDKEKQLEPFTNCTAIENGWVWNIPSWQRIGTGYVYSDKYVSDEEALQQFKNHLDKKGHDYSKSEFKNIKMRVGRHQRLFVKNVVAVGLSAGFIEPLESNGLYSTHEFLYTLVRTLNRGDQSSISQFDRDSYDSFCKSSFDQFADFVASHYALSHREDTEYWRDVNKRQYSKEIVDMKAPFYLGIDRLVYGKLKDYNIAGLGQRLISIGMRNLPLDKESIEYLDFLGSNENVNKVLTLLYGKYIDTMNKNKNKWNELGKNKIKLIDYLKEIHKNA